MAAQPEATTMRLQRFLARAGVASRRKCETLIEEGRIAVNGIVFTELGTKVDPVTDEVTFDGARVNLPQESVVLMLHKPKGYVTTMSDEQGRHTVAELVPVDRYLGLNYVGRLDLDTTGLLLFTNDGELCNRLQHPRFHVDKTYEATVRRVPSESALSRLRKGVRLPDGHRTLPAKARLLDVDEKANRAVIELTIREGRKHQVKLMCKAVGHPVEELHRRSFGPLTLGELPVGEWRLLDEGELAALMAAV